MEEITLICAQGQATREALPRVAVASIVGKVAPADLWSSQSTCSHAPQRPAGWGPVGASGPDQRLTDRGVICALRMELLGVRGSLFISATDIASIREKNRLLSHTSFHLLQEIQHR